MLAPHPLIELLLAHTDVAKLHHFKIDYHLVTLVERWRP